MSNLANYRKTLEDIEAANLKQLAGKTYTEADSINRDVKDSSKEAENIRSELSMEGETTGLVTPRRNIIEEDDQEVKKGFSSTAEMLKTFFGWNDKFTKEAAPLSTERDPEQVTNLLSPPETAAREAKMASRFPTAEQTSDKYALVMRKHGGTETNNMKNLVKDQVFLDGMDRLKSDHPSLPVKELYTIIEGESKGNTLAKNKNSKAVSLWQITPIALKDLKEKNIVDKDLSLEKIRNMDAGKQMDLYSKYLDRWGYDGKMSLAILQAAPKYRNSPDSTVVYRKGTKAYKQNSGWQPPNGGDITVRSIKNYYNRFRDRGLTSSLRPILRPKELEEKKEG